MGTVGLNTKLTRATQVSPAPGSSGLGVPALRVGPAEPPSGRRKQGGVV